ncbi:MAG: Fe2+-dependent dioxygenase [Kiloniellaceae bacterium]
MLVTIDNVLDLAALKTIRKAMAEGDFDNGQKTAGQRAKRVKHNEQLSPKDQSRKEIDALVQDSLWRNAEFHRFAVPRFINRPLFSRYTGGMNYGMHVDDALMGGRQKMRTDLSLTIFLSDPGAYDGGELEMASSYGPQEVKLPAGAAVVYPSSMLHRVKPVTAGERLAAVTWVQSFVADPARREVLYDIDRLRRRLNAIDADSEETDIAFKAYANLLRMWADV